ncbi:MAG: glutamate racemase [bacterium (Candidatus Ratteibacteria) CG01_land_8_20_14_3_00_40_19]|uniref:Glutamate racemase n=1 Tax=bacterium (Candidatus Ratteibacteria) CG01_land_8_20_14_3_00_40_19 TaxID=2014290 RepID=A0A2M7E962_9BACT|nr:MAG: glutamate racemase [bacterium (Candidatus Ratteibacteria) CG01_land_8_20_14_3_00_40_19]
MSEKLLPKQFINLSSVISRSNSPIGIFDSGIGGLTVVKQFLACLPEEKIVYFGDTARVPYGSKSKATVIKFALQNLRFLLQFDPKLIVVACNTISALALPLLRKETSLPVIGVLEPAVAKALEITRNQRIGIIGTIATIRSKAYFHLIYRRRREISFFARACPLFVVLVEENWLKGKIVEDICHYYLKELKKNKVDTLILGCTHYPLLKKIIRKEMGRKVSLVDSAEEVVRMSKEILKERKLLVSRTKPAGHHFFFSDEVPNFRKISRQFLGRDFKAKIIQVDQNV